MRADEPGAGSAVAEPVEMALPGLGGGTIRLSDFRGQGLVVSFFASNCSGCTEELPLIEDA